MDFDFNPNKQNKKAIKLPQRNLMVEKEIKSIKSNEILLEKIKQINKTSSIIRQKNNNKRILNIFLQLDYVTIQRQFL